MSEPSVFVAGPGSRFLCVFEISREAFDRLPAWKASAQHYAASGNEWTEPHRPSHVKADCREMAGRCCGNS
jgi:hypothetical protein